MSDAEKPPEPEAPAAAPEAPAPEAPAPEAPAPEAPVAEEPPPELDDEAQAVLDEVDMRELLRAALAPPPGSVAPSILPGVQRKLRRRSRGKFYGDGWSTAKAPRSTYLVTSLVMLALIAFVFLVLIPWSSGGLP
jgi:hypothetical protein